MLSEAKHLRPLRHCVTPLLLQERQEAVETSLALNGNGSYFGGLLVAVRFAVKNFDHKKIYFTRLLRHISPDFRKFVNFIKVFHKI